MWLLLLVLLLVVVAKRTILSVFSPPLRLEQGTAQGGEIVTTHGIPQQQQTNRIESKSLRQGI
jgi:hypothetical protein